MKKSIVNRRPQKVRGCTGMKWKKRRCMFRGEGCDVTNGYSCVKKQLDYMLARELQYKFAQQGVNLYEKLLMNEEFSFWGPWISCEGDYFDSDECREEASVEDLFFRAGLLSTAWYVESLVEDMLAYYAENEFLAKDFDAVQYVMTAGEEHLDGLADNAKYLSFFRLMMNARSFCEAQRIVLDGNVPVGIELQDELYSNRGYDNGDSNNEEEVHSWTPRWSTYNQGWWGCETNDQRPIRGITVYFYDPIINFFGREMPLHKIFEMPGVSLSLFSFLRRKGFSASEAAETVYAATKQMQKIWREWIWNASEDLCRVVQLQWNGIVTEEKLEQGA